MKTLVKDNVSLYLFEDAAEIVISNNGVTTPKFNISDLNSSNCELLENINTPPVDWVGGKYLYTQDTWVHNASYIEQPVEVPQEVSKVAAEIALIEAGMDTLPSTYFATLSGIEKKKAEALWDKNPVVKIYSAFLQVAISSGFITQAQVNALMIRAKEIELTEL